MTTTTLEEWLVLNCVWRMNLLCRFAILFSRMHMAGDLWVSILCRISICLWIVSLHKRILAWCELACLSSIDYRWSERNHLLLSNLVLASKLIDPPPPLHPLLALIVSLSTSSPGEFTYTCSLFSADHDPRWYQSWNLLKSFFAGWVISAEVQPLETRCLGQGITVLVSLLNGAIIEQCFLTMLCSLEYGVYILFAGCQVVATIFCIYFLPETTGKPFETC